MTKREATGAIPCSMTKNHTDKAKYNGVARDFRVAAIRSASFEESKGSEQLLAHGVADVREMLAEVEIGSTR